MMPRLLSTVLRRVGAAAALLAVMVLAAVWPARHVLLACWPERVEEVLIEVEPGQIQRRFMAGGQAVRLQQPVMARSRPLTLWRVETQSGGVEHLWLAGVRNGHGQLLPTIPAWLAGARVDGPLPEPVHLAVIDAQRQDRDINGARVLRMIQPNSLSAWERLTLWRDRLGERWRWPFTAPAGVQTTPPGQ